MFKFLGRQSTMLMPFARCRALLGGFVASVLFLTWVACGAAHAQGMAAPGPGMHAFTMAHAMSRKPPERLGGPLKVTVSQKNSAARFILPGTRAMDPAIFGTPEHPVGFEPAPFPMLGIPLDLRLTDKATGKKYTIVDHFSPFSDWYENTMGSVKMTLVDATAIDGATTKDEIDFEATFQLPDGANYKIVCKKPLAHGMAFPFFGGVVTNHLIHGGTGIAPRILPTVFAYAAFWGKGDVYKDGSLINADQLVHVWVSEDIRAKNGGTRLDAEAGNPSKGLTLHLLVPPYKVTPKGMVETPLKTMFMPFPLIKPNIMAEMKAATKAGDQERIAEVEQIQVVAAHTKEHIVNATASGMMFGMPFIHMKFDDVKMKAK